MTPTKAVLNEIQENNKKLSDMNTDEYWIQRKEDSKKYQEAINAFSMANLNLNLCKRFLEDIRSINFSMIGAGGKLKQDITEFLETINEK